MKTFEHLCLGSGSSFLTLDSASGEKSAEIRVDGGGQSKDPYFHFNPK